jgi:Ca2+/Na+ antiporter
MALEKPFVIVKTSLAKILRDPDHLPIYQDRVNIVNRLVTAVYLFARYIFVHAYEENEDEDEDENENEEDENENDEHENDAFNADVFMKDAFFVELLRSLQTRTRRASKDEYTLRSRQLIDN